MTVKPELSPEKPAEMKESPTPTRGFLDLPFELRLEIYSYCIPQNRVVKVRETVFLCQGTREKDLRRRLEEFPNQGRTNLLLLCKQISNECLHLLYGHNTFEAILHSHGEALLRRHFTDENRGRIRKLLLIARWQSYLSRSSSPDILLWASLLPNLKCFSLIASQTWYEGLAGLKWRYYTTNEAKVELRKWVKWIEPYLVCFGLCLGDETRIEIDYMGGKETKELIERHMPSNWQPLQNIQNYHVCICNGG